MTRLGTAAEVEAYYSARKTIQVGSFAMALADYLLAAAIALTGGPLWAVALFVVAAQPATALASGWVPKRWRPSVVAVPALDVRTRRDRRYYREHINPHGYPPQGHLCLICLRFFDQLEPPDEKICAACRRGNASATDGAPGGEGPM